MIQLATNVLVFKTNVSNISHWQCAINVPESSIHSVKVTSQSQPFTNNVKGLGQYRKWHQYFCPKSISGNCLKVWLKGGHSHKTDLILDGQLWSPRLGTRYRCWSKISQRAGQPQRREHQPDIRHNVPDNYMKRKKIYPSGRPKIYYVDSPRPCIFIQVLFYFCVYQERGRMLRFQKNRRLI